MRKIKKKKKKEEIEHKIKLIQEERKKLKEKVKKNIIFLDRTVYWVALFIAIIGNMLIAISIIPFLLVLDDVLLYVLLVIMGFAFGFFFEIVVRDIENIEKKKHIIISILLPSIAVISFFIITIVVNNIKKLFGITSIVHEPLIVGTAYSVAFILPYAVYQLILKKRK